jgi:hypothetical protein
VDVLRRLPEWGIYIEAPPQAAVAGDVRPDLGDDEVLPLGYFVHYDVLDMAEDRR